MPKLKTSSMKDTYVSAATPTITPSPSAVEFPIGGNKTTGVAHTRGLFKLDLSSIPLGSAVDLATFNFSTSTSNAGQNSFNIYPLTNDWDDSTVTWNTQPAYENTPAATFTAPNIGTYKINITDLVQRWVNGEIPNFGFVIIGKEDGNDGSSFRFNMASSENASSVSKPYLESYYNAPPSKPNIVFPNSGEVLDTTHMLSWSNSVDPSDVVDTGINSTSSERIVSDGTYPYVIQTFKANGKRIKKIKVKLGANPGTQFRIAIASYSKTFTLTAGNNGIIELPLEMNFNMIPGENYTMYFHKVLGSFSLSVVYNGPYFEGDFGYFDGTDITMNPGYDIGMIMEYGGSAVSYQPQITYNNGQLWQNLLSGDGLTSSNSINYDFTGHPESFTAKLRVRAYDGITYSGYDESDGVFTIQHNVAPSLPTLSQPIGSVDKESMTRLAWFHNDANLNDPQSRYELRYRLQGAANWNTITESINRQYVDFLPNSFPEGTIEWQVRTYDQKNLVSPWSNVFTFLVAIKPPVPVITYPANDSVPVSMPVISWSSSDQTAYTLTIYENDEVVWTDTKTSTIKAASIGVALQNEKTYSVGLKTKNSSNLWSEETIKPFFVSYTPPAVPVVEVLGVEGAISIEIVNPTPAGTQPVPTHNDIYKLINNEWVLIATNFRINLPFKDYNVKSGEEYRYKVRAIAYGVYSESYELTGSTNLRGVWIHDVLNPLDTVHQFKLSDSRSSNRLKDGLFMQFAGRPRKVFEQSIFMDDSVEVGLQLLKHTNDKQALEELFEANVVCYRDNRGRMLFGIIRELPVTDEFFGQTVNISVESVDYWEGV